MADGAELIFGSVPPDDDDLVGVLLCVVFVRLRSGSTDRVEDVVVMGCLVRTRDDDDDAVGAEDVVPGGTVVAVDDGSGLGLTATKF